MISTYRPAFFLPFAVPAPPFLGPAAPSKSSILLAVLRFVVGRVGGSDAAVGGRDGMPLVSPPGVPALLGGPDERAPAVSGLGIGGGPPNPLAVLLGGPEGGPPAPLTAREAGALGGGGVGDDTASSDPPFLLTHLFKSLSK